MNVQSVHNYSLVNMLSDGDAIDVLHMHYGMVCRHPVNKQS